MPDRFASSDQTNDTGYSKLAGPYDDGSGREWTVPPTPDRVDRNDPVARHGGDLQGMMDHLDYVAELGATAVWNTPLLLDNQERESYHGYACADYYHIDPRFGDNELYRTWVGKAHEKGVKVIMDVVTNHCGTAHWWMDNLPFRDWIHQGDEYMQMNALFSVYMDPHAALVDRERQESGWFVPSMPDMNLDNPFVLKYFQQLAIWWIEYADLDGLRVDTYPYNEPGPMAEWCKAVRREYPGINIVGECWDQSIPQVAYWQTGHPNKNGFDSHLPSIMDFPLRDAMIAALTEDEVFWSEGMTRIYTVLAQDFAYTDLDHMMTFFANHDHPRTGDILRADPARTMGPSGSISRGDGKGTKRICSRRKAGQGRGRLPKPIIRPLRTCTTMPPAFSNGGKVVMPSITGRPSISSRAGITGRGMSRTIPIPSSGIRTGIRSLSMSTTPSSLAVSTGGITTSSSTAPPGGRTS